MPSLVSEINTRQEVEQSLRESQRTLATLMSNLPGMVYRCRTMKWTMEFVSEGALALTGYSPADLIDNKTTGLASIDPSRGSREGVARNSGQPFQPRAFPAPLSNQMRQRKASGFRSAAEASSPRTEKPLLPWKASSPIPPNESWPSKNCSGPITNSRRVFGSLSCPPLPRMAH